MQSQPPLAPYLFYADVAKAAQFLQDAFGFALGFTSKEADGSLAHAQLLHGSGMIMLGHAGGGGLGLARSAETFGGKADQPWGDRMYCAVDPEGQFWMFAKRNSSANPMMVALYS